MADIIQFPQTQERSKHMITLTISQFDNGELEVNAQISDEHFTDYEIFEGIIAAAMKYAQDTGIEEEEDDND